MTAITDDDMRHMLSKTRPYSVVVLKRTPERDAPGSDAIVWEHGRRNFELRAGGALAIVCPVTEPGEVSGFAIFDRPVEEVRNLMAADPAVRAGIFTYEVHPVRGFPGDRLPA